MSQQLTQDWVEFYKCCADPIAKMAEINADALNRLAKDNKYVNQCAQAKNVGDMLTAQQEFLTHVSADSMNYAQKATSVWVDFVSECSKRCTAISDEMCKSPMDNAGKAMTSLFDSAMACNRQFTDMANEVMKSSTATSAERPKAKGK